MASLGREGSVHLILLVLIRVFRIVVLYAPLHDVIMDQLLAFQHLKRVNESLFHVPFHNQRLEDYIETGSIDGKPKTDQVTWLTVQT